MMKPKNLVESKALGIPLREDVARQIDQLVKTLPKECRYKRAGALPDAAELVTGERADISMVSVETVDKDNDVVLSKGMDLTLFQRNPVVMFAHNYNELPVGMAQWIRKVQGGIKAKTIYSDATELARSCWKMTQEGILKGKSIGFLPTRIRAATKEEISIHPEWKNANAIIDSAILLEFSIAPIPVCNDALVEAVAKGTVDKALLKRLGLSLPPARRITRKQLGALVDREVRKLLPLLTAERLLAKLRESYGV